jgi:hypothetical protein
MTWYLNYKYGFDEHVWTWRKWKLARVSKLVWR